MEKRPELTRDYTGLLTGKSCYDFCLFTSEHYDFIGESELAKDWLAEAHLYKMELDLGLTSSNKNPMIDDELEKNREAWDAVTTTWGQILNTYVHAKKIADHESRVKSQAFKKELEEIRAGKAA